MEGDEWATACREIEVECGKGGRGRGRKT